MRFESQAEVFRGSGSEDCILYKLCMERIGIDVLNN